MGNSTFFSYLCPPKGGAKALSTMRACPLPKTTHNSASESNHGTVQGCTVTIFRAAKRQRKPSRSVRCPTQPYSHAQTPSFMDRKEKKKRKSHCCCFLFFIIDPNSNRPQNGYWYLFISTDHVNIGRHRPLVKVYFASQYIMPWESVSISCAFFSFVRWMANSNLLGHKLLASIVLPNGVLDSLVFFLKHTIRENWWIHTHSCTYLHRTYMWASTPYLLTSVTSLHRGHAKFHVFCFSFLSPNVGGKIGGLIDQRTQS